MNSNVSTLTIYYLPNPDICIYVDLDAYRKWIGPRPSFKGFFVRLQKYSQCGTTEFICKSIEIWSTTFQDSIPLVEFLKTTLGPEFHIGCAF